MECFLEFRQNDIWELTYKLGSKVQKSGLDGRKEIRVIKWVVEASEIVGSEGTILKLLGLRNLLEYETGDVE